MRSNNERTEVKLLWVTGSPNQTYMIDDDIVPTVIVFDGVAATS